MEVIGKNLKKFMDRQAEGVDRKFVKQTQDLGGTLVMDIGPRGGGKTTKAVQEIQMYREREPNVQRVANVPIENAYYVPNILKFLATKLIAEGGEKPYTFNPDGTVHIIRRNKMPPKMFIVVDEGSISGLESRGSGTGMTSLNTYLLALSRKINVDCELVTQMMSQIDKRGQWLSDYYCYCQSFRELGYFHYQYYDANYARTQSYKLGFDFARQHLFSKFDTTDIPNYDELALAFRVQFSITNDNMTLYEDIKEGRPHRSADLEQPLREIVYMDKKALRPPNARFNGETILLGDKRYEVLQRDWDAGEKQYRYRLGELPEMELQASAMAEAGVAPIQEDMA